VSSSGVTNWFNVSLLSLLIGANLVVLMRSAVSWNILHNLSISVCKVGLGIVNNGPDLIAVVRFFAAVTICSSGVILGTLKRLLSDQWKVLTMEVPLVLGLKMVKHLQWSIAGPTSHP